MLPTKNRSSLLLFCPGSRERQTLSLFKASHYFNTKDFFKSTQRQNLALMWTTQPLSMVEKVGEKKLEKTVTEISTHRSIPFYGETLKNSIFKTCSMIGWKPEWIFLQKFHNAASLFLAEIVCNVSIIWLAAILIEGNHFLKGMKGHGVEVESAVLILHFLTSECLICQSPHCITRSYWHGI